MSMPTVLLAMGAAHVRLALIDGLRSHARVLALALPERVVAEVRAQRPSVVLIEVGLRPRRALDQCRQIKTDAGVAPLVGLLDAGGRIRRPDAVARECEADGILRGALGSGEVWPFVLAMQEKRGFVIQGEAPKHRIRRWLGR